MRFNIAPEIALFHPLASARGRDWRISLWRGSVYGIVPETKNSARNNKQSPKKSLNNAAGADGGANTTNGK